MVLTEENQRTWRKHVPVPLCPPQILYGLTQVQTWASVMRDQRLTT